MFVAVMEKVWGRIGSLNNDRSYARRCRASRIKETKRFHECRELFLKDRGFCVSRGEKRLVIPAGKMVGLRRLRGQPIFCLGGPPLRLRHVNLVVSGFRWLQRREIVRLMAEP